MMKRSVSIMRKRILPVLLAVLMCLAMLPDTAVFATGSNGVTATVAGSDEEETDDVSDTTKKLIVDETATEEVGSTYTTIQAAIDYIGEQSDKDAWTINIKSGNYSYFTVNQYISNLTISGESGATVDCSSGSIQLCGDTITLEGLTFTATNTTWSVPVIKDASSNAGLYYDSVVTIKNCDFVGNNASCALWICRLNAIIQDCTFDGFSYAIEIINETSTVAKIDTETTTGTITITGNIVTNCDFFIHYGVRNGIRLVVTSNYVEGSPDEVCASLFAWEGESITVTGNVFKYAAFGLQNAINGVTAKDFLNDNTFINSYTADDYYDYSTGKDYSVTYYAPELEGYTVVWSVSETGVTDEMAKYFAAALERVGNENIYELSFTTTNGKGDLVCMGLAYQALYITYVNEKASEPDLTKTIVLESTDSNGNSEVDKTSASAGGTVTFKLTSTIPTTLSDYITYTYDEESSTAVGTVNSTTTTDDEGKEVIKYDTYVLTFHDVMDDELILDSSSFKVKYLDKGLFDGETYWFYNVLDEKYYTITYAPTDDTADNTTEDGCTFEISIDLLALYEDDIINESYFGASEIVVTYTATLDSDIEPGAYDNTAWVTYPEGTSKEDEVTVNTYGISIFKYDQSTYVSATDADDSDADSLDTSDSDDETSAETITAETATDIRQSEAEGLQGAVFTIYSDEALSVIVATFKSDADGYATFNGLAAGTYYLVETAAPNNYVSSSSPVKIYISDDEDEVDDVNADTYFVYKDIANAAIPDTGGMGTTIFRIVGGCLLLAAVIMFVISRRRRDEDEV